ncbi:MAG: phage tail tape measure protein, partial [Pseudomonadota bacterium]|nr:phage tail tape measure protein [Pseudomonadota bacterium]
MLDLLRFAVRADNLTDGAMKAVKTNIAGVKGALATMDERAKRAGKSLRNIGLGLSVGVTGPLALLGKQSVQLYDTQVKAQAAVEAALASTGGAAGKTAQELFDMASGLQNVSTYGDEDILRNLTAPLLTFTKVQGDVFGRAQAVTLDYATLLQTDLKSAALQVGKALNDPVKGVSALAKAGVQFSDQQKDLIKDMLAVGNVAGAQGIILAELETQFKGQAAAAAATPLGQWQQMSNAIGDVKEQLGQQIVPFIAPLVQQVRDAVQWFGGLSEGVKRAIVVFGAGAAAVGPLLAVLGLATIGVGALVSAFRGLTVAMLTN